MAGQKLIEHDTAGGLREVETVQTGGEPSADKVASLNAQGQFDISMMPTGIGADTAVLTAVGAIAAGDFVNVFDNGGTPSIRLADASSAITQAHGFVLDAIADAATGVVYFEGNNTAVSGATVGRVFLSTIAGQATSTPPTQASEIVQRIGTAVSATQINFEPQLPIILA